MNRSPISDIAPEVIQEGVQLAGYHIESGERKFADFAKAMVDDIGEDVKPYLRSWYESIRYYPDFDNRGMSSAQEIDAVDLNTITEGNNDVPCTSEDTESYSRGASEHVRRQQGIESFQNGRGAKGDGDNVPAPNSSRSESNKKDSSGIRQVRTDVIGKRGDRGIYSRDRAATNKKLDARNE